MTKPLITFYANSQKKPGYFENILNNETLSSICYSVTGCKQFKKKVIRKNYNKGRLLCIEYEGKIEYITLSVEKNEGRNSSLQSVPTAINLFFLETNPHKNLSFYFLANEKELFTSYHKFMYRLMATVGVRFLNAEEEPHKFSNVYDLIHYREKNKARNSSNNSSYITLSSDGTVQIFAKTYGANKYESTLIGIACASIHEGDIVIYNIHEQDLMELPKASLRTLNTFPNIKIINTNRVLDKKNFKSDSHCLRSPFYLYNLHAKFGTKSCACCGCPIPEVVQGAHIWNVSDIWKYDALTDEQKYQYATSAHNGMWLCSNHHKLFDDHILRINEQGKFYIPDQYNPEYREFIEKITTQRSLPSNFLTSETIDFIKKRYEFVS